MPLTEAHQHGVFDPMTASMVRMPGNGELLSSEACQRTMAVFDGRLRYDMQFAFKRMDKVKATKGYAGPVVVCSAYFTPVAGYIPSRAAIKYLAKQHDMEVWLAPIAGTRVLCRSAPKVRRRSARPSSRPMNSYPYLVPTRASASGPRVQ